MIPLATPFGSRRPLYVHEKDVERYLTLGYARIEPTKEPEPEPEPVKPRRGRPAKK